MIRHLSFVAILALSACGGYQRGSTFEAPRPSDDVRDNDREREREVRTDHFDDTEGMWDDGELPHSVEDRHERAD